MGPSIIKYAIKMHKSKVSYKSRITPIDRFLGKTLLKIIPKRITPNQITLFRFITIPILIILLLLKDYTASIILFTASALSDAIDGALARTKKQITSWGAVYDPIADKLLIGSISVILVSKTISLYLGIAIPATEAITILSALCFFKGEIPPTKILGKVKGVSYSIGILLLLLNFLYKQPLLLYLAKIFMCLGLIFAVLNPLFYVKMVKNTKSKIKHYTP